MNNDNYTVNDDYTIFEKRCSKRLSLKFQVEIENLNSHRVISLITQDISVTGLGISKLAPEGMEVFTEEELEPDTPIRVRLMLPGCENEIILKAVVRWSQRNKSGIWRAGIEFNESQANINRYYLQENEGDDRGGERYCHLFQIEVRKKGSRQTNIGISANLTTKGMQIFSDVLLSTDTAVEVKMRILGIDEKMTVTGKILWARQEEGETWRMELAFDEPISIEKFKNL
ncbi:MAG: PilZ domain-containing protein [Candidatus Omnitrophica bacterium]|nr:PilZ domain-containing protein [Candidatus Omnitrophota bacterium]